MVYELLRRVGSVSDGFALRPMLKKAVRKALTFTRYPLPVIKTNLLLPACKIVGRPRNDQCCSFVCNQPWNRDFIRHYRRARAFRARVDHEAVGVIRVLSYSRSGSHNFLSRLHYLPSCFVLKENLCPDKLSDPLWLSLTPRDVTAADYMGFSLFGLHGLQQKHGENLRQLVVPFNKLLEFPLNRGENPFPHDDRVLFLVRNFFRMLMSRHNADEKQGREKWTITDDAFYASIDAHHRNIKSYATLMANRPDQFQILGHEIFCARPERIFQETTDKLSIGNNGLIDPQEFFVECLDGQTEPVVRDGALWDMTAETPILGTGGGFNPWMEPSLERTLRDDVGRFVKKEWVEYAQKLFGRRLVDLWLSDTPETYRSMSTKEFTQLFCES